MAKMIFFHKFKENCCTVHSGLSDTGVSDNPDHPTTYARSRQISYLFHVFYSGLFNTGISDNLRYPTRFSQSLLKCFSFIITLVYPTFSPGHKKMLNILNSGTITIIKQNEK